MHLHRESLVNFMYVYFKFKTSVTGSDPLWNSLGMKTSTVGSL